MKALERSQYYTAMFRRSSGANSVIGSLVWQIILLVEAFMGVIDTCKTEEDPFQNECSRVVPKDLPL